MRDLFWLQIERSARHLLRAFDGEGGGLGVDGFAGLGSADYDAVAAGGDGADTLVIDLREGAGVQGEGDVFGLAGGELDASEAVERLVGGDVGVGWREVELGYFFSGALAGVFYVGLDGEGVAGVDIGAGEFDVGVGEGGVAEAVAESVERLAQPGAQRLHS